jgi:hypothetical protein
LSEMTGNACRMAIVARQSTTRRYRKAPLRAVAWIALVVGCAHAPRQTKFMASIPDVTMSKDELRSRVFELGRRESALVEEAVANACDSTRDPDTKRAVIVWGLKAIPYVQAATMHSDPLVALGDQWALALQAATFAREGPGRKILGDASGIVERAARQMAEEAERVATVVFGANGVGPRRDLVAQWAEAHPITSGTFARPSASVAWPRALGDKEHSALGFVASADDRIAMLNMRIEMMNETLLDRVRWTSELIVRDAIGRENLASFVDSARVLVSNEHDKIIKDVAAERDHLFTQLADQREAAFADIARERARIFDEVGAERVAIAGQADALLRRASDDARSLIDRTLVRLGVGTALLIILSAFAAWFVGRRLRRPRRHEPRDRPRRSTLEPITGPTG